MASKLNIPTNTGYFITQRYNIEGGVYLMKFYYNYRSGWFVGLYDNNNTPISLGIKIRKGGDLFKYIDLFSGNFIVLDTNPVEGSGEVTRDNFGVGKRFQVFYFASGELAKAYEEISSGET